MGERLAELRSCMSSAECAAYIVDGGDGHQNHYIGDCDKRIRYLTGFSNSKGTAVVTADSALVWTAARHYLQASLELRKPWTLFKAGDPAVHGIEQWLSLHMQEGSVIGFDPNIVSEETYLKRRKALEFSGLSLKPVHRNLVDEVWRCDRKPQLRTTLVVHPLQYSGCTWQDKVAKTRTEMQKIGASTLVVTALDEIAWLLNVRGSDIEFNRVFYSYVIVTIAGVRLFLDDSLMSDKVRKHLHCGDTGGVQVHPYDALPEHVNLLKCEGTIWISSKSSLALCSLVPHDKRIDKPSPLWRMKAIKNSAELAGMRDANIRDSAVLCEFLAWLDAEVPSGGVTEITAADKLEALRRELPLYVAPSFATISSSGPNSAMPLYTPSADSDRPLSTHEMYMCDSGGHYVDGTTDVTRTVHFGSPSQEQKEYFTLALKSHIALSRAVFPENISPSRLDTFARAPLWAAGLDYETMTGHGVGASIGVVEDPPIVAGVPTEGKLQADMIVTDEPGYYDEKRGLGGRIENVCVVVSAGTKYAFGEQDYLALQPITLVPIQLKLVEFGLLTPEEISWLKEYHAECRSIVGECLKASGKIDVHQWLLRQTEP